MLSFVELIALDYRLTELPGVHCRLRRCVAALALRVLVVAFALPRQILPHGGTIGYDSRRF